MYPHKPSLISACTLALLSLATFLTHSTPLAHSTPLDDHLSAAQPPSYQLYLPVLVNGVPVGDPRLQSGVRLTDRPGDCWEPHLSPSGTLLVYLARPSAQSAELRLLDINVQPSEPDQPDQPALPHGRNDRTIDLGPSFQDLDLPTFSSDERYIVFAGFVEGQWDIFRLPVQDGQPADPSRLENLTATPDIDEGRPALSPDGRRLAYDFHRGADNDDIAVMDLLTRRQTRLTQHPAVDRLPAFAPDGRTIYFRSERTGQSQIHRVAVDGGAAERVSFYAANDGYATVAPDARTVLFESDRGGRSGIYLMDSTGRSRRALLAAADARFTTPRYGADGRTVVFSAAFGDEGLAVHLLTLPPQ